MKAEGPAPLVAMLKDGCLSPEELSLKTGAWVMFTRNNPNEGFVNGTQGTVVDFAKDSGFPIVSTRDGRSITAEPMDWSIEAAGQRVATVTQVPLRLAWAITVHKSQGLTLDAAVMDLSRAFEYGQGYVALSRVRTLAGLHLLGINARTFEVHPEVLAKDKDFRAASAQTREYFASMRRDELAALQTDFISKAGGETNVGEPPDAAFKDHKADGSRKTGDTLLISKFNRRSPSKTDRRDLLAQAFDL